MKYFPVSLILLLLLTSCAPLGANSYVDGAYSFTYPGSWLTMAEVYPDYQPSSDYYWLIVDEAISVTSARKPGETGAAFTVAWIDLPSDMELEGMIDWIYATVAEDIRSFSQGSTQVGEDEGYILHYQRQWGESWLQFQDVWLEKNKVVYLLSFTAPDLTAYQDEMAAILESFKLK